MARLINRIHVRLSARGRVSTGFIGEPEPRTIGAVARGRHLVEGRFLFGGHLVDNENGRLWDIDAPDGAFDDDRHGFDWLDDLAALGNLPSREKARAWTSRWVAEFGSGAGPGWRPGLTGRRVSRWISHSVMLRDGQNPDFDREFLRSLSQQTHFLARRHSHAMPGLPRFEAIGGLIQASLSLQGMDRYLGTGIKALADACRTDISEQGGLITRNPQELLDVFAILTWTAAGLSQSGRIVPPEHRNAVERIAPVLRALRHGDGGLARFHGGGRGEEGRLDQALAASRHRTVRPDGLAMGYARLAGGRTSLVADAAEPPTGLASGDAHASTLGFEMTSGRRPIVVNCGSGAVFGQNWQRAGRATPSHSTLCVEGTSSAQFGRKLWSRDRVIEPLSKGPSTVLADISRPDRFTKLDMVHDGYLDTHGIHHQRRLWLSNDGRVLKGEDDALAGTTGAQQKFEARRATQAGGGAVGFAIRFHLHPDVVAKATKKKVQLDLISGESWGFTFDGPVQMTLEPSLYLEKGHLEPRATKQIVLTGAMIEYATHVKWEFAKNHQSPDGIRDKGWVSGDDEQYILGTED